MKNTKQIEKVARIIYERGDAEMWGADDNSIEACERHVCEVLTVCEEYINAGGCHLVEDFWMQELGLEPDYLYTIMM